MKTAYVNENLFLAVAPKRNGVPYSGAVVMARIIDIRTDAELLAPIVIPEIGVTGIYKYLWTTIPQFETELAVIYSVLGRAKVDYVAFRTRPVDPITFGQRAQGKIIQSKVTIQVFPEQKATGKTYQAQIVQAQIIQPTIDAKLSQEQKAAGILQD